MIAQSSSFTATKYLREIPMGSSSAVALNAGGIKISRFSTNNRYISQTIQNSTIVTIEGEWDTASELSNDTSMNDLEWSLTHIPRSRYDLTPNNFDGTR